jgi:hypothetical protein
LRGSLAELHQNTEIGSDVTAINIGEYSGFSRLARTRSYFSVIARTEATKQSKAFVSTAMDCFAALAMTIYLWAAFPYPSGTPRDLLLLAGERFGGDGPLVAVARLQALPVGGDVRAEIPG